MSDQSGRRTISTPHLLTQPWQLGWAGNMGGLDMCLRGAVGPQGAVNLGDGEPIFPPVQHRLTPLTPSSKVSSVGRVKGASCDHHVM